MRSSIRNVELKGLVVKRRGDREYRYLRIRQTNVAKLPSDCALDSPEFLEAYAKALAENSGPVQSRNGPGSIAAVADGSLRSKYFSTLSEGYQATLRRHLGQISDEVGAAPAGGLRDYHVRKNVAEAASPHDRLKTWRFWAQHGLDTGVIRADPTIGVRPPRRVKSDGHPHWTDDEKEAYRERWPIGTTPRLCFEVISWTGFRLIDAVSIGPGHVDRDGVMVFRQSKVKAPAFMPWTAALPPYAQPFAWERDLLLEAVAATNLRQATFLATEAGASRSEKGLGNRMREWARAAGVEKSAHGLRKSRGIALAEGGASAHQIMSWGGWQTLKEAEHYCRLADRRRAVMGQERKSNVGTDIR
ncbi:Tyrosine recombinase XerC [Pseudooceanicola marinus]|uniref:Tyrosine recombinase XerC n=1 Tax=Pseudooceanicola marinus TaxID=396013 RepID=A0A1X7AAP0_9RHOB|nr:integrase [Pseudooceanicola marinus]SLN74647.1 Tyrosine recombinase XerC [Pseudooceanicola marinus]